MSETEIQGFHRLIRQVEQVRIVRAVRNALVSMIPVLTIGAFALILQTLPVPAYQALLETPAGQVAMQFLQLVYSGTFGVLSVYMTILISHAYTRLSMKRYRNAGGSMLTALICFFVLAGAYLPDFNVDYLGPKSMFLALLTGLGATALYNLLYRGLRSDRRRILTIGADLEFTKALAALLPTALTLCACVTLNMLVVRLAGVDSFRMGLNSLFDWLFSFGEVGFAKGFFFVFLSSLLWFFGIHGSDTLEHTMQTYFVPGLEANQAAIAAGEAPTTILTKGFFDCFVLMGGCGATICLLIAILLFSRSRARRNLGLAASFPMLFNINEMMVFGLPIIFNPVMFIPFILVPLACYSVAYLATSSGLVPPVTQEVAWTTPVILGGYHATGSVAGSLLQLLNIAMGTAIYIPFVRMLDRQSEDRMHRDYDALVDYFKEHEQMFGTIRLTDLNNVYGELAKELGAEMRASVADGIVMGYQPQHAYDGRCVGVEALLRWRHPLLGTLYPPLAIRLAEECGFLCQLEEAVLDKVLEDRPAVLKRFGRDVKVSFNVTGTTVVNPHYLQHCMELDASMGFAGKRLCLEVTEQATLAFGEDTVATLKAFRDMGLMLAIDDFSMGQTSIHYLKDNLFDVIKLDGSLVRELFTHENSREIVASIANLANTLGLMVLAEFVETEKQREALHELGCDVYQGYLYSPAVFLDE